MSPCEVFIGLDRAFSTVSLPTGLPDLPSLIGTGRLAASRRLDQLRLAELLQKVRRSRRRQPKAETGPESTEYAIANAAIQMAT
jgi:hypothetical protein